MTRLSIGLLGAVLAVGTAGCGDDGSAEPDAATDAGRDTGTDSGTDAGGDGSVDDAGACMGCVADDGECVMGDRDEACGAGGAACVTCGDGEVCADGECAAERTCGPDSCAGCCTSGDDCLDGDTDAACGTGGAACNTCPGGASCSDGRCVLPCAESCTGCCSTSGECVAGTADTECGGGGETCSDCTASGAWTCAEEPSGTGGTCITEDCATTCGGCCSGDSCLGGDSASACGQDGAVCAECGTGRVCTDGSCVVDPDSRWDLRMLDGEVPGLDDSGSPWDLESPPDTYVQVTVMDGATAITRSSSTDSDTTTPVWDEVVIDDVPASALETIDFAVWDSDFDFDDSMGECEHTTVDSEFSNTRIEIACGTDVTLALALRPH